MVPGPLGWSVDLDGRLSTAQRRLILYAGLALFSMAVFSVIYRWAMVTYEGVQVSHFHALTVAVESMTTTGYGEDAATWDSPQLELLAIVMQLTGVVLIFLALPLFLVPLVEEALRTDPPAETDLTGHVVICQFTPRGDTLVAELEAMDLPYVVVEADYDRAVSLHEDDYEVVHGDPERVRDLRAANVSRAMAVVADADDETNASIILSAKEAAPDVRVISVVEDATVADYHRYAGADQVVSPRHLLGGGLASKATTSISAELDGAIEIGEDFEVAELLVQHDSRLVGTTVAEAGIGEETGANIIGAWFRGEFVSPPDPEAVIDEATILLVVGREDQLESLKALTTSSTHRYRRGKVVIAGYGEVGQTVHETLTSSDLPCVVVDREEKPGVDVVGDITDRGTLEDAGVDEARTVILALDDDRTAIFAALAINQVAPETEVIARANDADSVSKLYRAGAEYVLALATVSGRILASSLLDEEVISPGTQIEVVRTEAPDLVGETLAGADVRARTGCTVVAAERNGDLLTDVGPEFTVESGDTLVVAGIDADILRFNELVGAH